MARNKALTENNVTELNQLKHPINYAYELMTSKPFNHSQKTNDYSLKHTNAKITL
jgi:hypothetical protein